MLLLILAIKAIAVYLVGCLLYVVVNPLNRWKYRHIPGPAYRPIFGNLPEMAKHGSHECMLHWKQQYGPVCKVWIGHRPVVWISDADLGKRINYKLLNRPRWMGDPLASAQARVETNKGLFTSRDDVWRKLHKVWQPAFYTDSVHACAPLMAGAAQQLCARLQSLAALGHPLDIWREIGNLTMATVGTAAFGIDLQTIVDPQKTAQAQQGEQQHALIQSANILFAAAGAMSGSLYQVVALLVPPTLVPVVRWLAHWLPDEKFKRVLWARLTLYMSSLKLLDDSRTKQQETRGARGARGASAASAASGASGGSSVRRTGAIAPGSFLGLLLSASEGISDFQICMQVNTFTMAGYETTANTLAFCVYLLATHPEAEQKVLDEIRAAAATTSCQLSGSDAAAWLVRHMEQKLPYTCAVVTEALRLYPPGASTLREVGGSPLELGGYLLPPGTAVSTNTYALQRDPDIWQRAGEFLPERWLPGGEALAASNPAAYLPFGSGARMCVGFRFALQEVRLGLMHLFAHFQFEIQWQMMSLTQPRPPLPTGGRIDSASKDEGLVPPSGVPSPEAAAGSKGKRGELKTVNGFTLSPAGGIWVKLVPRRDDSLLCHL